MKRPFFVAAVIGLAAAYLSIYSSGYIVLSAGVIIIACYFIFYKYSKTPLFYILFVLIFPIMVIRTEYYSRGMRYQGKLTQDCYAYIKGEAVSVIKGGNSYATRLNNALLIPDWENNDEKVNEPVKSGIIIYSEDSFCVTSVLYIEDSLSDEVIIHSFGYLNVNHLALRYSEVRILYAEPNLAVDISCFRVASSVV